VTVPVGAPQRRGAIVAFYDEAQPASLADHVLTVQRLVARPPDAVRPRPVSSTHTTVLGLDSVSALHAGRETDDLLHATDVDLAGLLRAVAESLERRPLLIQYGGFAPGDERPLSRGESLFSRSLQQVGHQVVPNAPPPRP